MTFKEAFELMKQGKKIKMPEWKGYWAWEDSSIKIHCSGGIVLDIRETEDVEFTLGFIMRDDWIIADETNSKLLQGEVVCTSSLFGPQ